MTPREQRPVILVIAVLVVAAIGIDLLNGRFWASDFRVYYDAADAWLHGQAMYGVAFGEDTGFFKYAPVLAILFTPFTILPFAWAAVLHVLLLGVALILSFVQLERVLMRHAFGSYPPRILARGLLVLLCIAVLLSRELHLGNINLWLVLGVILATRSLLRGNTGWAGALFGALWMVKPYLGFMLIVLLINGQWRVIRSAFVTILVGLFVPLLFTGPAAWWSLHQQWLAAMASHSGYLSSPDTFAAIMERYLGIGPPMWLIILVTGLLFGACYYLRCRRPMDERARAELVMMGLWTSFALVPHLVITDQEHFLYALPLLYLTLARFWMHRQALVVLVFVASTTLYAMRSSDLWGDALERYWVAAGALGLGNLLLLLAAWLGYTGPWRAVRSN